MRYYNIALVGHVMNGKTTLVKALTGIETKRDSAEQASGRTIKLGYANCILWQCDICGNISTTSQNEYTKKNRPFCCGKELSEKHRISFLDCPGHHSYIRNMVKGTSVVDGAIIVVDSRGDKLGPQTIEHLSVLEVLGVKNVIIAQNKVDLVTKEKCVQNYRMIQKELSGSSFEHCKIIPISAQKNTGMDFFRRELLSMIDRVSEREKGEKREEKSEQDCVFSVIRSFDINKPGSTIDQLKGGVLGVSISQGKLRCGDCVTLLPGILRMVNGVVKNFPVKTKVNTIYSENFQLQEAEKGGLYGIGTCVDPFLTRQDQCVGILGVVRKDEQTKLDIVNRISMRIFKLKTEDKGDKGDKITVGGEYKLIIGSNVVKGRVNQVAKRCKGKNKGKLVEMVLSQPICTIDKKCLIYSTKWKFLGYGSWGDEGTMVGQSRRSESANVKEEEKEEKEDEKAYVNMITIEEKVQTQRTSIPIPKIVRENKNCLWTNAEIFCKAIHRTQTDLSGYISSELHINTSVCKGGMKLVRCRMSSIRMENILKNYIEINVMCKQCYSVNTQKNNKNNRKCLNCGSVE